MLSTSERRVGVGDGPCVAAIPSASAIKVGVAVLDIVVGLGEGVWVLVSVATGLLAEVAVLVAVTVLVAVLVAVASSVAVELGVAVEDAVGVDSGTGV